MSESPRRPQHKNEFDGIYNLDDPAPYYAALAPVRYRMPEVVAGFIRGAHDMLAAGRSRGSELRLLDFACGYGANGALLRHRTDMAALYNYYASRRWRDRDGRRNWPLDQAHFERMRHGNPRYQIAGIDIAETALEYARALSFVDVWFTDNLVETGPGPALRRYIAEVDIVIESGALGAGLPRVFGHVLAHAGRRLPWFLYCPRPDVDWSPLDELWSSSGYVAEPCSRRPVRYRRPLSARERQDMLTLASALGRPETLVLDSDYLLVDLMLARPRSDRHSPDIERLQMLMTSSGAHC